LNVKEFIESTRRLFQVTTKPGREELWLMIKISLVGIGVVGAIGFMVRILFLFVGLMPR
jgi:protein translocase SEC61 complex gamma subunit